MSIGDTESVHRIGGGSLANLRLSLVDRRLVPPGLSLLIGGTPQEAAEAMRSGFPFSRKWQATAGTVGTTTVAAIRAVGFDVISAPTDRFANHARLVHPDGEAGFTDGNLARLAATFNETTGC